MSNTVFVSPPAHGSLYHVVVGQDLGRDGLVIAHAAESLKGKGLMA